LDVSFENEDSNHVEVWGEGFDENFADELDLF